MAQDYLKPKTKAPQKIRSKNNDQFINPPPYMDKWGGFTSGEKIRTGNNLQLQKKPGSRGSKPL